MTMLICLLLAVIFAGIGLLLMAYDLVGDTWGSILDWSEWATIAFTSSLLSVITAAAVYIIGLLVGGVVIE